MNLCFLIAEFGTRHGGQRVLTLLCNALAGLPGYQVSIVVIEDHDGSSPFPLSDGVTLRSLGLEKPRSLVAQVLAKATALRAVRRYFSSHQYDVVVGVGVYPACLLAYSARRSARLGWDHNTFEEIPAIWKLVRRLSFPRLDGVVAMTASDHADLTRLNPASVLIPNPRPWEPDPDLSLDDRAPVVLAIGRLVPYKGFDLLIQSAREFLGSAEGWSLVILGEGAERERLERQVEQAGLSGRVSLPGNVENVEDYYRESAIFVLSSRKEGFGMVLLEAQAYGLAVVSFDCPNGPAGIINHEEDGYLVPCFDTGRMAGHLVELMEDPGLRARMGRQGQQNTERFSIEAILPLWTEFLESAHRAGDQG